MNRKSQVRGSRKASTQLLGERATDEILARTIISEILDLEHRGVLLPAGWRDRRPMTLSYLNTMLNLAIDLAAATPTSD